MKQWNVNRTKNTDVMIKIKTCGFLAMLSAKLLANAVSFDRGQGNKKENEIR